MTSADYHLSAGLTMFLRKNSDGSYRMLPPDIYWPIYRDPSLPPGAFAEILMVHEKTWTNMGIEYTYVPGHPYAYLVVTDDYLPILYRRILSLCREAGIYIRGPGRI